MNVVEAIKARKSIRDFKSDPVSQKILQKILKIACRAPSASNAQPWQFTVIAGNVLENIRLAAIEKLQAGVPSPLNGKLTNGLPAVSIAGAR